MKKIRVAEFFGEPLNYGGQEAFIINLYSKIDKQNYEFSFITPFECENQKLKELVKDNKDDIIITGNNKFDSKLRKKSILQVAKKYLTSEYDVVHIHSGSVFTLFNVAKIAKKNGIKKVIVHSHAGGKVNIKYKLVKFVSDLSIRKYVDYFFACSEIAAKWKFPKKIIKEKKYNLIKNGIDLDRFRYDPVRREEYRKKFELENKLTLIHVGRFCFEKNQEYIIRIFVELLKLDKTSELFLVGGKGDTLEKIENMIKELELEDKVHILINRSDVNNLINMSDVFILPSVWEGLPFTGIEAQANGIPCIFSDTISQELDITNVYNKLSIEENPKIWANKIIELNKNGRQDTLEDIRNAGFNIRQVCKFIENIYGGKDAQIQK